MGWHEQGDGKMFVGVNIEQGRVKDFESAKVKSALKKVVDDFGLTMILTPSQSIIFKDINPSDKFAISNILSEHGILQIEIVDPLVRHSMACPALPLCGLAVTEAERRMPEFTGLTRQVLNDLGMDHEELIIRVTGCPNGCARPYMGELAFVGDGPDSYQVRILYNLKVSFLR
jgi:sulfite reductase (ferredoxin)